MARPVPSRYATSPATFSGVKDARRAAFAGATNGAFGKHLANTQYNASQIRFINQIIDYLTKNGVMDPGRLYEQPFTNDSPLGLDGLFAESAAADIVNILAMINRNAGWTGAGGRSVSYV